MAHFEKKLSREEIYTGRVIHVVKDTVELENGKTSTREVVFHHGGAGVVALTEDREVYLVRQFRYAFGEELLEIPAGKLESGEEALDCAKRELGEECGCTAETFVDLHPIYPSVGYDTEVIYLYLATGLDQTEAHPDEDEFLSVVKLPLSEAVARVLRGEIRDAKTVAALLKVNSMLST